VVAVGAHSNIPALPPGVTYTRVATGGSHTVLLRSDGIVVGVGSNDFGQLNLPELPEGVTYVNIGAGYNHTVLLRSDGVVVRPAPRRASPAAPSSPSWSASSTPDPTPSAANVGYPHA